jgi:transcription antitermination factor NusA-like protein
MMNHFISLEENFKKVIEKAKHRSKGQLNMIRGYYDNAISLIPAMLDDIISSGKGGSQLKIQWKHLLKNSGITDSIQEFVEKSRSNFQEELKEKVATSAFDIRHIDISNVEDLVDAYHDEKKSTKKHKYVRAGLRSGAATATAALAGWAIGNWWNPTGWLAGIGATILVVTAGIGIDKATKTATNKWEKSTKKELTNKRSIIINELRKKLREELSIAIAHCNNWLNETEESYLSHFHKLMDAIKVQCKEVWLGTVKCLSELDDISLRLNHELINEIVKSAVPAAQNGIVEVVGVSREPGYATKILVKARTENSENAAGFCIGKGGARVRRLSRILGGEKIAIIDASADIKKQIMQALSKARLAEKDIEINKSNGHRVAYIRAQGKQAAFAIGDRGSNIRLACHLLGIEINIINKENHTHEE